MPTLSKWAYVAILTHHQNVLVIAINQEGFAL